VAVICDPLASWSVHPMHTGLGLAIDLALPVCYHEVHPSGSTRVPVLLFLCFMSFLFVLSVGLWYKSKQLLPPIPHLQQTFFTYITFILIQ
jgi:hypothetical protein